MWRSISAPTSYLQIVPEYSEEEAKAKAEKEKAERVESENTDLLLKLMQQVHKPALNSGQNSNKTCPGPGPIKVIFSKYFFKIFFSLKIQNRNFSFLFSQYLARV